MEYKIISYVNIYYLSNTKLFLPFLDIRYYKGMNATSQQLKQVLTDFSLFTILSCSFSVTVFIGDRIQCSYKCKITLLSVDTRYNTCIKWSLLAVIFLHRLNPDCRIWHFSPRSRVRKARVIHFQVRKIIFRCRKIYADKAQVRFGWGSCD